MPFDQIYWNGGSSFAQQGDYAFGSEFADTVGKTANRNPDSTFSYAAGSDHTYSDWWLANLPANRAATNNIFQGIHKDDPLTVDVPMPFNGGYLVLARRSVRYLNYNQSGVDNGPGEQDFNTGIVDFRNITIYRGEPAADNVIRISGYKDIAGTGTVTGSGTTFTFSTIDPRTYFLPGFKIKVSGVDYSITAVTSTNITVSGGATFGATSFTIRIKYGSPDIDDVMHIADTGETTAGTANSSTSSSFNESGGSNMWNKTWGFVPVKYDSAGNRFFESAAAPFKATQHPMFSDTGAIGIQQRESAQDTVLGGGFSYTTPSEISAAAFPGYGHNIWNITNGPKPAFGNNGGGSPNSYAGRDIEAYDKPWLVTRVNREQFGAGEEDADRQEASYPYLGAPVGYDRSDGHSGTVDPRTWETTHYYTIWDTDDVISPGTYSVTLQHGIRNSLKLILPNIYKYLYRHKYILYFVAK
ncbi:hypothetical protein CL634_10090 [bacterium]|nr:hypothetical protein [bacterium]